LSPIIEAHLTETSTPHNPDVPEGLVNFEYVIEEVTVSADNQPVVKFRILMDGVPVTFNTFSQGGTILIDNFTGSPSFLVAYALPQDGVETPADYNQLGKVGGQPATVSILNTWNGTQGSLSGPDQDGNYVATLNGPTSGSSMNAARFPVGAQLRAVALQGYFSQVSPASNRYTVSVVKGVTGDAVRREVVEVPKCINCHESLQLHGGNRVNEVQVCVICHNPTLSSSGRVSDPQGVLNNPNASASAKAATQATIDAVGSDPLVYPEASMQLKSLVHGIHSSAKRTFPFEFVRDRGTSGVFYFDFSEVTFPGVLSNCETCHKPGTYDTDLPENLLVTTDITTDGLGTSREGLTAARNSAPNPTDLVHSQTAGACYFCHDSNPAAFHYGHNGGVIDTERSEALRQE
jgi:OmcA/MtrC family decaheme c-type cytochrome